MPPPSNLDDFQWRERSEFRLKLDGSTCVHDSVVGASRAMQGNRFVSRCCVAAFRKQFGIMRYGFSSNINDLTSIFESSLADEKYGSHSGIHVVATDFRNAE